MKVKYSRSRKTEREFTARMKELEKKPDFWLELVSLELSEAQAKLKHARKLMKTRDNTHT